MTDLVWNKMETRNLCYGSWDNSSSTIKAVTFGVLVELAEGRMENYRSDLWHDALWIDREITGPITFEWVLRDWGTHIGDAAATFNYGNFGGEAFKYRFELEDNDGKWNLTIYEGSPVIEPVPTVSQEEGEEVLRSLGINVPDTVPQEQDVMETVPGYLESVFPLPVENIFPSHGNNNQLKKGNNVSYDLERLLDGLREKLDEANSTKDELEEKQGQIEDAVGELESYIDEMESVLSSLDSLPEVSIYVDLDTVSFDS